MAEAPSQPGTNPQRRRNPYKTAKKIARDISIFCGAFLAALGVLAATIAALSSNPGVTFLSWLATQWPVGLAALFAAPSVVLLVTARKEKYKWLSILVFAYTLPVAMLGSVACAILFPVFTYKGDSGTALGAVIYCLTFSGIPLLQGMALMLWTLNRAIDKLESGQRVWDSQMSLNETLTAAVKSLSALVETGVEIDAHAVNAIGNLKDIVREKLGDSSRSSSDDGSSG